MKIKILKKKEINSQMKLQICNLKKTFWNYTLESHMRWFLKNVRLYDIHILLFDKKKLIGYNLLRKRNYFESNKKVKKNYFYFDTLIIKKEYRKKNLSKKIMKHSILQSRKNDLPLILICKKKHIDFYEKFNFKLLKKNFFEFKDHNFRFHSMVYTKKSSKHLFSNKIQIHMN